MEVNQHQQPQSFYGVGQVAKSGGFAPAHCSYPSPIREHKRNTKIVHKASARLWWNDKEMQRKRRVAKYKLYAAQGKLKSSLKKGFCNFKLTCKKIVSNF